MDYNGIVLSILVQCPVPARLSASLPATYLVAPFFGGTQEKHCSTYTASHIVGHNIPESH